MCMCLCRFILHSLRAEDRTMGFTQQHKHTEHVHFFRCLYVQCSAPIESKCMVITSSDST